jgi:hypothetical protein
VIVIGPAAIPPALATVTFASAVPALGVARGEAAAAVPVPFAFGDRAGAVEDDDEDEDDDAAAPEDDAGPPDDRDAADADSADADKDWLAEQPTTATVARTAQAGATLTPVRRAMPPAGAHGHRADVGQRMVGYST